MRIFRLIVKFIVWYLWYLWVFITVMSIYSVLIWFEVGEMFHIREIFTMPNVVCRSVKIPGVDLQRGRLPRPCWHDLSYPIINHWTMPCWRFFPVTWPGKFSHSYGKSPSSIGRSSIDGPFSIAMSRKYQRVVRWFSQKPPSVGDFPMDFPKDLPQKKNTMIFGIFPVACHDDTRGYV